MSSAHRTDSPANNDAPLDGTRPEARAADDAERIDFTPHEESGVVVVPERARMTRKPQDSQRVIDACRAAGMYVHISSRDVAC